MHSNHIETGSSEMINRTKKALLGLLVLIASFGTAQSFFGFGRGGFGSIAGGALGGAALGGAFGGRRGAKIGAGVGAATGLLGSIVGRRHRYYDDYDDYDGPAYIDRWGREVYYD